MPLEQLGSGYRTTRLRQKIMALTPLPIGSTASEVTDAMEGRAVRSEDGCCGGGSDAPPAILYRANYGGIGVAVMVQCVNYYFLGTPTSRDPLPVGTVISITNTTNDSVVATFTLEGLPGFASITIPANQTGQYTVISPRVTSVQAGPLSQPCFNTPPITYSLFPAV